MAKRPKAERRTRTPRKEGRKTVYRRDYNGATPEQVAAAVLRYRPEQIAGI